MQAVILAGGESSRFYPFNYYGHKSLVTLLGKTLIERTIDSVVNFGIKDIVIVEDSKQTISKKISKGYKNINLRFVVQKSSLGMGDALLTAEKLLDEEFFVISAYHFDFEIFAGTLLRAKKKKTDIAILTREEADLSRFGSIKKVDGKIKVDEKSKESESNERIVGIYLLNKEFFDALKKTRRSHYDFEDAISKYSNDNEIVLVKTDKKTLSLKYPWDLLEIKDYLLSGVKNGIVIEESAEIMKGAVISGPCYIGKNVYVGTNSIVRSGTVLEDNVRVGAQMEIKNSILMRGVTTHSGFIGDSLIGENSKLAAGFNTGNVRLDRGEITSTVKGEKVNTHRKKFGVVIGSNTSFGIGVGTMPGIIIGNDCIIGPGTTVMENIQDKTTYYVEFKKTVQKKYEPKK